ncbi:MAG: aminoacyl--tRNA ligase-related protein [Patescibacteria group bacterium]
MRQSSFFSKTTKQHPEDELSKNAQLLIRGGFIAKSSAGVYSLLPLGLRVLNRINTVVREEMDAIHGQELFMPSLIHKSYWQASNRWDVDIVYRAGKENAKGEFEAEYGLGWTHEEVIASIAKKFIESYKDLPRSVYQIQTKFRREARPQAGLLRGREFLMKDLYSFHTSHEDLDRFYKEAMEAYTKIFNRLNLETIITEASGGAFTKEFTHEFQVPHTAGEDTIYCSPRWEYAKNKEVYDPSRENQDGVIEKRSIEVGNIFRLGTRFAESFNLFYTDQNGEKKPVVMGSYGIGPTRVMGTIAEIYNDERGLVWPESSAPFQVHLLLLPGSSDEIRAQAEACYTKLQKKKITVLYDDRDGVTAGEKFADADLIGIPYRVLISTKTAPDFEVKKRTEKEGKRMSMDAVFTILK